MNFLFRNLITIVKASQCFGHARVYKGQWDRLNVLCYNGEPSRQCKVELLCLRHLEWKNPFKEIKKEKSTRDDVGQVFKCSY